MTNNHEQGDSLNTQQSHFESMRSKMPSHKVAIIGLGGAGGNALADIMNRPEIQALNNVDFFAANTDFADLDKLRIKVNMEDTNHLILLGPELCKGGGAGGDPKIGRAACLENSKEIQAKLKGYSLVIMAFGLGGGTGSSASVVIADILKSMDVLSVGIANTPFTTEGDLRANIAAEALEELDKTVDSLIVVPNDKIKEAMGLQKGVQPQNNILTSTSFRSAFALANNILALATSSLLNIIVKTGEINIDFNDIRATLSKMGRGLISTANASGDLRAKEAVTNALNNPLLPSDIEKVGGIIVNIYTNDNLSLVEFDQIVDTMNRYMDDRSKVTVGVVNDPNLSKEDICITVILTGIDPEQRAALRGSDKPVITARKNLETSDNNIQALKSKFKF